LLLGLPAQEIQHLVVVDHVVGAERHRNADHVELRAVRQGDGRRQHQHRVAGTGSIRFQIRCTFAAGQA